MKSRIVTVTLAVAMAFWMNSAAYSQTQTEAEPPVSLLPAQGVDDLDTSLQSELPLKGLPLEPAAAEAFSSIAAPADLSRVTRDGEWLYALRGSVTAAPWIKIALGSSGAFVLGVLVWTTFASRKRSRRAYRRILRTSGGSRPERLEEVVASVQLTQSRSRRRQPLRTGEEWPR